MAHRSKVAAIVGKSLPYDDVGEFFFSFVEPINHSKENLLICGNGEIYETVINKNYKCDLSYSLEVY